MKKSLMVLSLVLAVAIAGCASEPRQVIVQQGYDFGGLRRVAVVDVKGPLPSEGAKDAIATYFEMQFMAKGYTAVERSQVKKLLEEQKFQASDVTAADGAARAGQILNVDGVLMVSVTEFTDEKVGMTAKLVDAEDGTVVWADSSGGSTGKMARTIVGATLGAGAGMLAGGSRSGKVAAGAVGGVLGGVAGSALSPRQDKKVREVVTELCATLPARTG